MLVLVEGTDYIAKKATIKWFKSQWSGVETIWTGDHTPEWVASYVVMHDNLVIRNSESMVDMLENYLKQNRNKNWLFEAIDLPSSTFKRRMQRLGQWIQCIPGSEETKQKIQAMAKQFGFPPDAATGFLSLTEAYRHFVVAKLTSTPLQIDRRQSDIWDLIFWRKGMLNLQVPDIITIMGGLARLIVLSREQNANKWRLVQECARIAPLHVNELYGASSYLISHPAMVEQFLDRAFALSKIVEEEPTTPVSYLYCKLR